MKTILRSLAFLLALNAFMTLCIMVLVVYPYIPMLLKPFTHTNDVESPSTVNPIQTPLGVAVLVMDAWERPFSEYWIGQPYEAELIKDWYIRVVPHMQNVLAPFLFELRNRHVPIIFSANGSELTRDVLCIEYRDPIINRAKELNALLKGLDINTVMYVGYSINACILERSTGTRNMSKLGYNIIVVEDATLDTLYYSYSLEAALSEIQTYGTLMNMSEALKILENAVR